MKVIAKTWSTGRSWTIGIVVTENEVGKRRMRCAPVSGISEKHDLEFINDWGSSIDIKALEDMIDMVKRSK